MSGMTSYEIAVCMSGMILQSEELLYLAQYYQVKNLWWLTEQIEEILLTLLIHVVKTHDSDPGQAEIDPLNNSLVPLQVM